MRYELLGRRRGEWIAYLRNVHCRNEQRRRSDYSMKLDSGMIPFGAVSMWVGEQAAQAAQAALVVPVARVIARDTIGVVLAVLCPWCGAEHRHVVTEDWDPAETLTATCDKGTYRVRVGQ